MKGSDRSFASERKGNENKKPAPSKRSERQRTKSSVAHSVAIENGHSTRLKDRAFSKEKLSCGTVWGIKPPFPLWQPFQLDRGGKCQQISDWVPAMARRAGELGQLRVLHIFGGDVGQHGVADVARDHVERGATVPQRLQHLHPPGRKQLSVSWHPALHSPHQHGRGAAD